MYQFKSCDELLALCKKHKLSISEIAIRREMEHSSNSRAQVRNKMKEVRDTMWEAIQKGIKDTSKSQYGLVGGDAKKSLSGGKQNE